MPSLRAARSLAYGGLLADCWAAVSAALGVTTLSSGGGSTLGSGNRASTLVVGGGSTLGGVGGSTLRTDGRAAVGSVAAWYVKMLARRRRAVAWSVDRGRMGPAVTRWQRALMRDFSDVIARSV